MRKNRLRSLAVAGVFSALALVLLLLTATPVATVGTAALAAVCGFAAGLLWHGLHAFLQRVPCAASGAFPDPPRGLVPASRTLKNGSALGHLRFLSSTT